jgi:pyruvate/2-oxoglutarate/acetoin dehydrogenase E1 component
MEETTEYLIEVNKAMEMLAAHSDTIFVGQAVSFPGTAVTRQLKMVDDDKKLEMPVAEEFQTGFCLGLALKGYIPVCIYPRFNFALLAANQIVNHIDKWPVLTDRNFPKIILKVVVGSDEPLNPGYQHKGNFTDAFKHMCMTIEILELTYPDEIIPAYKTALNRTDGFSTMIVEHANYYASEELYKK